jgi:hypothetical protein
MKRSVQDLSSKTFWDFPLPICCENFPFIFLLFLEVLIAPSNSWNCFYPIFTTPLKNAIFTISAIFLKMKTKVLSFCTTSCLNLSLSNLFKDAYLTHLFSNFCQLWMLPSLVLYDQAPIICGGLRSMELLCRWSGVCGKLKYTRYCHNGMGWRICQFQVIRVQWQESL